VSTLGSERSGKSKKPVETPPAFGTDEGRTTVRRSVFGAITLSFDDHRLGVMEEAVQDGGGESGIIVEDACQCL